MKWLKPVLRNRRHVSGKANARKPVERQNTPPHESATSGSGLASADSVTTTPAPDSVTSDVREKAAESKSVSPVFRCQVEEGSAINKLAVEQGMFKAGEGKAFLVTFPGSAATSRSAGDSGAGIDLTGVLTCHYPCFNEFSFEILFNGSAGAGGIRCPVCGSEYSFGFDFHRAGGQDSGKIGQTNILFWFSPHTRGPGNAFVHGVRVDNVQVKGASGKFLDALQQSMSQPEEVAGASTAVIVGKYVHEKAGTHYLELKADGECLLVEGSESVAGRYEINGAELTIFGPGSSSGGTIQDNSIIDSEGDRWLRQG
jgi:hypothetical protein